MSWYRFRTYFKDGNSQFRVLDISRKYYDSIERNITYQEFVRAGKEYVIEDMCLTKMSFKSIAKLIPKLNEAFSQWLHEKKNQTFSLQEFFQHSVQGQFKNFMKGFLAFKDQPWEVQQKLIHELEEKKRKNPNHHHMHELHHEESYISGKYNGYGKNLTVMRREELQRRFQQEYGGLEWTEDGRRVIDEDYDEEQPAENRTLHANPTKYDWFGVPNVQMHERNSDHRSIQSGSASTIPLIPKTSTQLDYAPTSALV